jgi:hypothetical protein
VVVAEVYPVAALFARLAGKLAGNPWLAGGAVSFRDRPAWVEWRGSSWVVRIGELPDVPARPELLRPWRGRGSSSTIRRCRPERIACCVTRGLALRLAEGGTSSALPRLASMPDRRRCSWCERKARARGGGAQGSSSARRHRQSRPACYGGLRGDAGDPLALPAEGLLGGRPRGQTLGAGPWTFAAWRGAPIAYERWSGCARLGGEPETTAVAGGGRCSGCGLPRW